MIASALKLIRNFGFVLSLDDGASLDVTDIFKTAGETSLMTIHVVRALKFASDAYRALGNLEMASNFEEGAKFGFMIITGFENSVDGIMDE